MISKRWPEVEDSEAEMEVLYILLAFKSIPSSAKHILLPIQYVMDIPMQEGKMEKAL